MNEIEKYENIGRKKSLLSRIYAMQNSRSLVDSFGDYENSVIKKSNLSEE